jgi:hypothetical protein
LEWLDEGHYGVFAKKKGEFCEFFGGRVIIFGDTWFMSDEV